MTHKGQKCSSKETICNRNVGFNTVKLQDWEDVFGYPSVTLVKVMIYSVFLTHRSHALLYLYFTEFELGRLG